jgi:hypothetical protein
MLTLFRVPVHGARRIDTLTIVRGTEPVASNRSSRKKAIFSFGSAIQ